MSKYLIGFGFLLLAVNKVAIAQNRIVEDTMFVNAKIAEMDTIEYYVVIRAVTEDQKKMTILSQLRKNNVDSILALKRGFPVEVGHCYNFALKTLSRIQYGENRYFFISLRRFDYNGKHFLDAGELPYLALNMYGDTIYSVKE